jgi:hypothetical protein
MEGPSDSRSRLGLRVDRWIKEAGCPKLIEILWLLDYSNAGTVWKSRLAWHSPVIPPSFAARVHTARGLRRRPGEAALLPAGNRPPLNVKEEKAVDNDPEIKRKPGEQRHLGAARPAGSSLGRGASHRPGPLWSRGQRRPGSAVTGALRHPWLTQLAQPSAALFFFRHYPLTFIYWK